MEKAVNAGDDNSPAGGWGLFAGARRARKRAPSPAAAPRRSGRRLRRRYGLVASAVGFSLLILGLAHVPAHALWSYDGWSVNGSYDQIIVIPANFYLDQYINPTTANEKQREYPSGFLNLETKGDPTPWLHLYSYTIFGEDGTAFATRCQV